MGWSEDAARNRELWTETNAAYTDEQAARKWSAAEITWGVWDAPETELLVFGDVAGLDAVELGCGTAYVSAWLARRGARAVGVDITPAQLESARRCMAETGIEFPLVEADGAATGLPDECADLVHSEYGASIWVDPYRWIPEAARLLRAGGRLVFLRHSPLLNLCTPDEGAAGEQLVRSQFGTRRLEWPEGGVEFTLAHGDTVALLRKSGFEIERLVELQAPASAEDHAYYDSVTVAWASRWPAEEIWVARKR
jgi:SAM-dependent methyltransferase